MPQCPQILKVNEKMALPSLECLGQAANFGLSVQSTDQCHLGGKKCFQLMQSLGEYVGFWKAAQFY